MRGIDAAWAVDYPTARTELQKQKFDVVVLDVRLAEMNGLELKRLIEAEYPGMRYIFLTGKLKKTLMHVLQKMGVLVT